MSPLNGISAGDRGLPLPGAEEGRTQSPQLRRFARPSPLGEGRKRHSRQGGSAAAAPVFPAGDGTSRAPSPTYVQCLFTLSGAASAAPARNDIQRQKAFKPAQRRGDLKEGISPSFIVSIRGVKRGKKSKSSPSCVVLFPPFSWTSKRKGIVFPRPLHAQRENERRPG